eukprot:GFYU01003835.1.p1 GENE.GFYU01003835.1~~GFYU01003835.1.p1  ORF type:complete len:309 (-),score=53.06 GFYU01003835.1:81-962(-)
MFPLQRIASRILPSASSLVRPSGLVTSVIGQRCLSTASYDMINVEKKDNVALITLNRPKALNALCTPLMNELSAALADIEGDKDIGCTVLTGSEKAFAAGADIKEMQPRDYLQNWNDSYLEGWSAVSSSRKPVIAAVNGFALGGGCELAMMCDIIIAGDKAKFGQPEIKLGTIPGAGGSQRLLRAIGKSRAMELCLTGDFMGADEAERKGLVSRVVPASELVDSALDTAKKIASMSKPITAMCKEAVNASYEMSLEQGLIYEKRLFWATFASEDRKEGMTAFVEKRDPAWQDK